MKDDEVDPTTLKQFALEGYLGFQDYAVAKWYHHINAFIDSGQTLMQSGVGILSLLDEISLALDDFISTYDDENWDEYIIQDCREKCEVFKEQNFYHHLLVVAGHIYSFQKKGFEARHAVSIKSLAAALERNRKLLEELPASLTSSELVTYRQFYDDERRFKCTKITCPYFSQGFKDAKTKKKHVNLHDRPFQCEACDGLAGEYGFSSNNDLEK